MSTEVFIGSVKHPDRTKGCSYIECPDAGFDKDVYCHSSVADPWTLNVGDIVAFTIHVSNRGTPQASAPLWILSGGHSGNPTLGDYVGLVKELSQNGTGFVECSEVKEQYGKDAYVFHAVMQQCGLTLGDRIAFNIHLNKNGWPQVSSPCWKSLSDVAKGGFKGSAGSFSSPAKGKGAWSPAPKGATFGHKGAKGAKGRMLPAMPGPVHSVTGSKGGCGKSGRIGKGVAIPRPEPRPSQHQIAPYANPSGKGMMQDAGQMYLGTVKMADPVKGFTMIECPGSGFDRDVYAHSNIAVPEQLVKGHTVSFHIHVNSRGQPQASAPVWQLQGFLTDGKTPPFGDYVGVMGDILQNGNGFVKCPEVTAVFPRDAYIHSTVVQQCGLSPGDVICFNVHVNSREMPQISAPVWKSVSPPGAEQFQTLPAKGSAAMPGKGGGKASDAGLKRDGKSVRSGGKSHATSANGKGSIVKTEAPADVDSAVVGGDASEAEAGHYVGTVSAIDEDGAAVTSLDSGFEVDVLVEKQIVDPSLLAAGDMLAFTIEVAEDGTPQAQHPVWKLAGDPPADGAPIALGDFAGTIGEVSSDGSGHIDCPDVTEQYGKDAYISHQMMADCDLQEGDIVAFSIHLDKQGSPQVSVPVWKSMSFDYYTSDEQEVEEPAAKRARA